MKIDEKICRYATKSTPLRIFVCIFAPFQVVYADIEFLSHHSLGAVVVVFFYMANDDGAGAGMTIELHEM